MQYKEKSSSVNSVIGFIIVSVVVVAFLYVIDVYGFLLFAFALAFLILAGLSLVVGLFALWNVSSGHNPVFLRAGGASCLLIYFVVTAVLAFLVNVFYGNIGWYIAINLLLVAGNLAVIIALFFASKSIARADERTMDSMFFMQNFEERTAKLLADSENRAFHKDLEKVYETVKFSDKVGHSNLDIDLANAFSRLENALPGGESMQINIPAMCEKINSLLGQRRAEVGAGKRGGF